MPKIPSIPRISIVVPFGSEIRSIDNKLAFEDTLVSVLANRPAGCEILVVHNRNYDDPFELKDEVRFVLADSPSSIDLIAAGAKAARGRFVHVLAPGFQAIEDWTETALQKFDDRNVGVVAPAIHNLTDRQPDGVIAAGWQDTRTRLCQPIKAHPGNAKAGSIGAYLQASFWRRNLLRSLTNAFQSHSMVESTYAYGHLARTAGWRCDVADSSIVTTELATAAWDPSSYDRGRKLSAVRAAITRSNQKMPLVSNIWHVLRNPRSIGETLGQVSYRGRLASTKRRLQISEVETCVESSVLAMPKRTAASKINRRRAA